MKSGELVTAYVGRTWVVVVTVALLLGLGIWGVGFAFYQSMVGPAALPMVIALGAIASTGPLIGFRARAVVTSDGLAPAYERPSSPGQRGSGDEAVTECRSRAAA